MDGHVHTRSEQVRRRLEAWLQENSRKWEKAIQQSPPDFDSLEGIPHLPGNLSYGDVIRYTRKANVYEYPRPSVTVDVVVFGLDRNVLKVLLIKRGRPGTPFEGCWAIPGGFVNENEDLDVAARRELQEETHAEPTYIEQLATFGAPGRDPRGHVISVAYMALARCDSMSIQGDDDAQEAKWWDVSSLPALAFDHSVIVGTALRRLRSKILWQPVGMDLLPPTFALQDLQTVYEVILGHPLDKRNFRRKILSYGVLESAESVRIGFPGRRPQLFRFDRSTYDAMLEEGKAFEV